VNSGCFVNFNINKRIVPSRTWLLFIAINILSLGKMCVASTVTLQGTGTGKLGQKTREGEARWYGCSMINSCLMA